MARLFLNDGSAVINGWMWKIVDQPRFTMFIPEPSNPIGSQFNLDVLFVNEPSHVKIEDHLNDISFLSGIYKSLCMKELTNKGSGIWVCPGEDRKKAGPTAEDPTTTPLIVYMFGTRKGIKLATNEVLKRLTAASPPSNGN